jgi:hypothetical protein
MEKEFKNKNYVLSLDVSTTCIGIALFEDLGDGYEMKMIHHISPKIKPKPTSKIEELIKKDKVFREDFINRFQGMNITKVVIEEPLLASNNVYTVASLLRFNGLISRSVYDTLGIAPIFISSYDSRKYAFPELMAPRKMKRDGTPLTEKQISKNDPVLFGDYPFDIDKKYIIWEKVSDLEPKILWDFDKNNKLKSTCFDMSDAYACGRAYFNQRKLGLVS